MSDKKDKDKKSKGKKKGFFGSMFGGKDESEPVAPATPTSVQARLAAGPAKTVIDALTAGDTDALRKALLSFGSATPANSKAVTKLRLDKGELYVGSHPLSEILSRSEGSHRPRPVREDMAVDKETWEAACRLNTILIQALVAIGRA